MKKFMNEKEIAAEKAFEDGIIAYAMEIMERRMRMFEMREVAESFNSPQVAKDYLKIMLGVEEREHFVVLFMDNQYKLIKAEKMFSGTIDGASIYPREIVKAALNNNAAAVILGHNHPSGSLAASQADRLITKRIKEALDMVDIRVLDHIIVCHNHTYSFAENGIL